MRRKRMKRAVMEMRTSHTSPAVLFPVVINNRLALDRKDKTRR